MQIDPDRDLVVERLLPAPQALVWRCLTDPAHLSRWWVPHPVQIRGMDLQIRPGGRFAYEMILPDGGIHALDMMILTAEAPGRLVFTDMMTAGFRPVAQPFMGFAAELSLSPRPEGTQYRATVRHARAEDARRHDAMGFHDGWGTVAGQFAEYVRAESRKDPA